MSASSTPDLTPAELVLKSARATIDKEMAALNAGDGSDSEEMLRFRAAFVAFLEAEVRDGMEPGDAIYATSLVAAFLRGVFVSASCEKGCDSCAGEAAAELAESLFAGAGINASVQTVPMPSKPTQPTTKH